MEVAYEACPRELSQSVAGGRLRACPRTISQSEVGGRLRGVSSDSDPETYEIRVLGQKPNDSSKLGCS